LLPLMFEPPPLLLLLPQDAAPNASAQTPATAKTERGFKTRIPLLNAGTAGSYSAHAHPAEGIVAKRRPRA
jgi:hypothetical protein